MPFAQDMPASARRHLEAAEALADFNGDTPEGKRRDVAGYLFGIAAECAVKAMMLDLGMRPLPEAQRKNDPFFAHFPELRTMLRDTLQGRRGEPLLRIIENDSFMNEWEIRMRYSHGRDILDHQIRRWRAAAVTTVGSMGT